MTFAILAAVQLLLMYKNMGKSVSSIKEATRQHLSNYALHGSQVSKCFNGQNLETLSSVSYHNLIIREGSKLCEIAVYEEPLFTTVASMDPGCPYKADRKADCMEAQTD